MDMLTRDSVRFWFSSRFGFIAAQACLLVLLDSLLRVVLLRQFASDVSSGGDLLKVFAVGVHLDLAVGVIFFLPFWTLLLTVPDRWLLRTWFQSLVYGVSSLFWVIQIFLLISEYFFFEEFRSRFNTVAIDYLLYPHEVFVNIWDSYPIPAVVIACIVGAGLIVLAARRVARRMWEIPVGRAVRWRHILAAVFLGIGLTGTVSLNETRFSRERVFNELASNGTVSVATAAWSRNLDYTAFYPTVPAEEAHRRVRKLLAEENATFAPETRPVERRIAGDAIRSKMNLVVMLEESLGSEFWGSLGRLGPSLTPEMDRLALTEGMLFDNLYATGNRTVRGFEGVLSSFPPLPGDSIVKRDRSENVETIARVLKRDGYETLFLYGGRGVFDGMRSYSVRNGYDRFVEQKDFSTPVFTTIWGVSNEDLYQRTVEELRALHNSGKPFFATALSVSNHKPFTYPPGRISEDPGARSRENAVKYTDWALGKFFEAVKKEPFWTNTLFVVIADHGARVYGSQTIPIRSYEIPMVLLGPSFVKGPSRLSTLGCQLDVAPTLLGLLGRPYSSMFFGRNLLHEVPGNRLVLLNHNRAIGAYRDHRLAVLSLNKKVEFFRGDPKLGQMIRVDQPEAADDELGQDAITLFQVADELYMGRRFCLDPPAGVSR